MPNSTPQPAAVAATAGDCPFWVETYPTEEAAKQAAKPKKRKRTPDPADAPPARALVPSLQEQICPLQGKFKNGQNLDAHYRVFPPKDWVVAKRYKSFRLNETSYFSGQFVYVANPDTVENQRKAGVRNPTDEWVAKILEIRAADVQNVFARIAWMYWPQELPKRTLDRGKFVQGRQPYHGKHELIASNHMDIIHAMSVTEHAKVDQWMDSDHEVLDALYWRQGYDTRTAELSSVSVTCRCKTPPNPDKTLIGCTSTSCNQWLHYECLEDDILMRTWDRKCNQLPKAERATNGTNGIKAEQSATPELGNDIPVKRESSSTRSTPRRGVAVPRITPSRSGSAKPKGKKGVAQKPYAGLFEAKLVTDDGPARWVLRDLRPGVSDGEKQWTEEVHCLVCNSRIE